MKIDRFVRTGVPVLLWGMPGVGKTASVLEAGRRLGLPVRVLIASWMSPTDFGFPVLTEETVEAGDRKFRVIDLVPPRVAVDLAACGGILFLDEMTSTPPALQAPLLSLLQGHRFGALELDPRRTYIVGAANPPEIAAGGWELSAPLANRVAHVEFKLDVGDWLAEFPGYWGHPPAIGLDLDPIAWAKARAIIASFLNVRRGLLLQEPAEDSRAYPTPRSWDMASRLLADYIREGEKLEQAADDIAACVGVGPAAEFAAWAREADLPDPEEVLADPNGFPLPGPDRLDRLFAILSGAAAVTSVQNFDAAVTLFERAAAVSKPVAMVCSRPVFRVFKENRASLKRPDQLLDQFSEILVRISE